MIERADPEAPITKNRKVRSLARYHRYNIFGRSILKSVSRRLLFGVSRSIKTASMIRPSTTCLSFGEAVVDQSIHRVYEIMIACFVSIDLDTSSPEAGVRWTYS